jgi:iron complex outermembrane receptor protein
VKKVRLAWLVTASIAGLSVSTAAAAQEQTSSVAGAQSPNDAKGASASSGEELPEIVVTATKRSESLQSVPISVTAFSSEKINQLGIKDSQDIAAYTPSLQWTSGTGYSRPSIYLRGLGNNSFHVNANGAVGIYTDGVYLGSVIVQPFQLFDLERVEVLRGPQGTLYGRNTTAGLVNFITAKPKIGGASNGFMELTGGSYGSFTGEGAIGLSLGDKAAIRIAAQYDRTDGFFKEQLPNVGDLGAKESFATRTSLIVEPTDDLSVLATFRYGKANGTYFPYKQVGLVYSAANPFAAACPTANPALGQCTDAFGFADTTDPYQSYAQFTGREDTRAIGGQVEINWTKGAYKLTSLTAYDDAKLDFFGDEDSSPTAQLHDGAIGHSRFWSTELRLTSDYSGPFNFILGGNYYHEKVDSTEYFTLTDFGPGVLTGTTLFGVPEGAGQFLTQRTATYALFGNANYKLTKALTLRVGLRWTRDKRDANIEALIYDSSGAAVTELNQAKISARRLVTTIAPLSRSGAWSNLSGNVSLDYKITPDVLLYASFARGFKGGEFNGGALFSALEATLTNPEKVDDFEAGIKSSWFNGRLRVNVGGFLMKLRDQQVFILAAGASVPIQSLSNAGRSTLKGFEFEIDAKPLRGLSLNVNGGYIDAKFNDFLRDPFDPTSNLAGNRLAFAPRWTVNGFARYDLPIDDLPLFVQADVGHVDSRFYNVLNAPFQKLNGYTVVGMRAGVQFRNWSLEGWVKNVGGERYYTTGSDVSSFGFYDLKPGAPRTFGATARISF